MSELVTYLVLPFLVSAAGGFAIGWFGGERRRTRLVAWMVLPLIVYTAWTATLPPASEGGYWAWWLTGLFYLSLPFVGWGYGAILMYDAGGRLRRPQT